MKILNQNQLPDDVEQLKKRLLEQQDHIDTQQSHISDQQNQIGAQQDHIKHLEEIIKLAKNRLFGKSSEKSPDQAELFDEAEVEFSDEILTAQSTESEEGKEATEPKKEKPGRKPLPKELSRVVQEHDLPEADKICQCGCQKTHVGDEVSEQLDIIPAVVQVIQHRRKKYLCKACESNIVVAGLPKQPIPKSNASPGLLAHIAVAKYQYALPLYRMETYFAHLGIHLPRSTQANWMIKSSQQLQSLYNQLNDQLLASGYVHMDETPVQVLKEPDKPPESKSYMWVRKTGDPNHPIILFDYADSRRAKVAQSLLPDYQGYLQTDDYAGYHRTAKIEGITQLGCFAHARRKFIEAQKVSPSKKGKTNKADMAINMIKKLYLIEQEIKDKSPEERYQTRQTKSKPQLETMKTWLDKSLLNTLPKGKAGEALAYLSKNWVKLSEYIKDGRLNIDNNPVENAIRPFAIGRKNWLFSDSQKGAKASAMMYSMIETAKANGLEPYQYLKTVFTKLPQAETLEDIEALLPWNIELLKN